MYASIHHIPLPHKYKYVTKHQFSSDYANKLYIVSNSEGDELNWCDEVRVLERHGNLHLDLEAWRRRQ